MSERSERLARNEAMFRAVNERVEEVVQPGSNEEIDFICECGDSDCIERVTLKRQEYEHVRADATQFVVAPGHELPDIEETVVRTERFFVVRKRPGETEIAEESDPRE